MRLLFPGDPARPGRIDPDWSEESEAAAGEGVASGVIDVEALARGDASAAVRRVRPAAGETAVYRGGMLQPPLYAALHAALVEKGFRPLTSPEHYERARFFPKSAMPLAVEFRTLWLDGGAIFCEPNWEETVTPREAPPLEEFAAIAARIDARFFTLDLAHTKDRRWLILEADDGQVSIFPRGAHPGAIFRTLRDRLP